jgi:type I restriction enzyme S subunit
MTLIFIVRPINIVEGARSTIAHLPVAKLKMVPLALPPVEEQERIVHVISACDAKIAALERESALLAELFRALLEELMTGRVAVAGATDGNG